MRDSESGAGQKVYVVDDDPSVCVALKRLLTTAGYDVTTYSSAGEFLDNWPNDGPACLVLDLRLPGVDGMELHRRLRASDTVISVIFMTGYGDVPTSVEAMKSGAFDFLQKPVAAEQLLEALSAALDEAVQQHVEYEQLRHLARRYETLTPREREVMDLMLTGRRNKQIARELGITEKTVKVHRARVMAKMGARRLAPLVQFANRLGIGAAADDQLVLDTVEGSTDGYGRGRSVLDLPRIG
ncbi:MAG: response regulator [Gemmatimonas sp.]|nr:response regulator [Gemmatimonas sp.]